MPGDQAHYASVICRTHRQKTKVQIDIYVYCFEMRKRNNNMRTRRAARQVHYVMFWEPGQEGGRVAVPTCPAPRERNAEGNENDQAEL